MITTFTQFNYDIIQLQNEAATKHSVTALVEQLSQYMRQYRGGIRNSDEKFKAIVFAFAGHGKTKNRVVANDHKILNLKEIVEPLVKKEKIGEICDEIPKLFCIDACRGQRIRNTRCMSKIDGNYRRDYATIQGYEADDVNSWMTTLARVLRDPSQKDNSYQDVIATVNTKVYHQLEEEQRPQAVTQLTTGPLKLYYKVKTDTKDKLD